MTKVNHARYAALFCLIWTLLLTACTNKLADDAATQAVEPVVVVEAAVTAEPAPTAVAADVEDATSAEVVAITLPSSTEDSEALADESEDAPEITVADVARPEGWSEATHSNDVDPNYAVVFPQDEVNTMTIVIDSADWQAMIDNMTEIYGEAGERTGGGRGQGGGANLGSEENPDYVAATIEFEGDSWTNVGVRFKGNSTLRRGWNSGSLELPFKLDFDEFEDDYPEIDNQRFYGFKQLSLSSPSTDDSYVRTALAYDVLQDAGLMAPETAWYELYVDYGDGPVSFGLYTVVEVIDDTVIETALGDDDGNIYEGDGEASTLAAGTLDQLADSFQKENNDESDYSDLEALYTVLHADTRLTDSDQWRSDLEAVFDVDTFLRWLATNTVMVNWDTYGEMAHNFYLYHDPETDLLTWIGWDYNESFMLGRRGSAASLSHAEESAEWPLIRYLLDEPAYYAQYTAHVADVTEDVFDADAIAAKLAEWEVMLAPYVSNETTFSTQLTAIETFVYEREQVAESFIASMQ